MIQQGRPSLLVHKFVHNNHRLNDRREGFHPCLMNWRYLEMWLDVC